MIFIGCDHGGLELKNEIFNYIKAELGLEIKDLGIYNKDAVDYPDMANLVCQEVLKNKGLGIVICGTGIGISISSNKIKGIRCALCSEEYSARMAKLHNNANVLALGGRTVGAELAKSIVKVFFETEFSGDDRHARRVNKITSLEE
jgi:ribose 5-phosphate isomerase B